MTIHAKTLFRLEADSAAKAEHFVFLMLALASCSERGAWDAHQHLQAGYRSSIGHKSHESLCADVRTDTKVSAIPSSNCLTLSPVVSCRQTDAIEKVQGRARR